MRAILAALGVGLVIVLGVVIYRASYYGYGAYSPPERPPADEVDLADTAPSDRLSADDTPMMRDGLVLVDYLHSNALNIEELNILFSRITARQTSYEIVEATFADDEDSTDADSSRLVEKLRNATGLIIPTPRQDFTEEEQLAIQEFVERGGRLLLIGDPTRLFSVDPLNSVAGLFDITFVDDYLYSLENNDLNYRNVVYTRFNDSPVTDGLSIGDEVIFYASNSLNSDGNEIILGDETTFSSIGEGGRVLAAAALSTNDQVLAVGDLTFFSEPYSAAENNGTLINNIADFITGGSNQYEGLAEFPRFFNESVDIVFPTSLIFNSQFADSVPLKNFIEATDRAVTYTESVTSPNDVIFIGRFDNFAPVERYLDEADISLFTIERVPMTQTEITTPTTTPETMEADVEGDFIEGRITIGGVGELELGGSTLFHLHENEATDQNTLIILSDDAATNEDAFELLTTDGLRDCLVTPMTAVCQTESPDEAEDADLPPSVRATRIDKILVVSDNDGRERNDEQTSAEAYFNVLSDTYQVDIWTATDENDPLDLDTLLDYDAVIWTTGDYWDDSIARADVDLLTEYIEVGGNLLLSGSSIAFDWDHTPFVEEILHADYLDFARQRDLRLSLPDHPISEGFEEETVIEFARSPSSTTPQPDVVSHLPEARVIFERGSDSLAEGAASVIAYEDSRAKIAYFAFPTYLLPDSVRAQLINNTIAWFTVRPLDPPSSSDYEPFELDPTEDTSEDDFTDEEESTDETDEDGNDSTDETDEDDTDDGDEDEETSF